MADGKNGPEAMDPSIRENVVGHDVLPQARVCYAAETLVEEVTALFPETAVDFAKANGRGVALEVIFQTHDLPDLEVLLSTVDVDARVESVVTEDGQTSVLFHNSFRTQDSRDPFGLSLARSILGDTSW